MDPLIKDILGGSDLYYFELIRRANKVLYRGPEAHDFEISRGQRYRRFEDSPHHNQSVTSTNLSKKLHALKLFKRVTSILGNKHFLYHSTLVERIDAALGSLAWLDHTDKMQTITGVLGSCSKGNHLSTATTAFGAFSHVWSKYMRDKMWRESIDEVKKVVVVVIPPSVTELLAENGRLIPFHNDTYVKIEGVCIPLLDLRKVPEHITDENLVRLLVPGKALIFDIRCSWSADEKQLK